MYVTLRMVVCFLYAYFVAPLQVPADILAQHRFLHETDRSVKKASKPKQVKKLFSKPKLGKSEDDKPSVQWVDGSTEKPPIRCLVTVTFAEPQAPMEAVKVKDATTAADLLKACIQG